MKIKSITTFAITIPLRQSITMGGILYTESENLLTRIESEKGLVGWGEAPSAPTMTGETVASMQAAVKYLSPLLVGRDPSSFVENMKLMDQYLYGNSSVKAALEIACYDLAGKHQRKSMSQLLGGPKKDEIPVLWMLAAGNERTDCAEALLKLNEGFNSFKIKVGGGSLKDDIIRVTKIREIVGNHALLSADANQAWDRETAINFVKKVGSILDFIEQPVMGSDLDSMRDVARASNSPIAADEGLHTIEDIISHNNSGAASGGSLKMIKLGGVLKALEAAQLSTSLGMKINLAGKICETSISSSAVSHLAASIPQIDWGLSITCQYAAGDVVKNPINISSGKVTVPKGYGLGMEVDEQELSKYVKR